MSARSWMPLCVADHLAGTAHPCALQSGAHLHLVMRCWRISKDAWDAVPNAGV
jgi:uncharacterized protein YdaU (DUF1376 family)